MNEEYEKHWNEMEEERRSTARFLRRLLTGLVLLVALVAIAEIAYEWGW